MLTKRERLAARKAGQPATQSNVSHFPAAVPAGATTAAATAGMVNVDTSTAGDTMRDRLRDLVAQTEALVLNRTDDPEGVRRLKAEWLAFRRDDGDNWPSTEAKITNALALPTSTTPVGVIKIITGGFSKAELIASWRRIQRVTGTKTATVTRDNAAIMIAAAEEHMNGVLAETAGKSLADLVTDGRVDLTHDIGVLSDWINQDGIFSRSKRGDKRRQDGQAPAGPNAQLREELEQLNAAKAKAVTEERFEDAGQIKARIAEIEAELAKTTATSVKTDAKSVVVSAITVADKNAELRAKLDELKAAKAKAVAEERYKNAGELKGQIAEVEAELAKATTAVDPKKARGEELRGLILDLQKKIDNATSKGDDVDSIPGWVRERKKHEAELNDLEK